MPVQLAAAEVSTSVFKKTMRPCKIKFTYDCHLGLILDYYSKGLKLSRWDIFGLPLTQRVKILQN